MSDSQLFQIDVLQFKMSCFLSRTAPNASEPIWPKKRKKMSDFRLSQIAVFKDQNSLFSIQNGTKHFFRTYLAKKERMHKFQIFDQNRGLTPVKKCQIFDFLTLLFLKDRMACFLSGTGYQTLFLNLFGQKRNDEEISKFLTKTRDFETMSDFRLPQIDVFK